MSTDKRSEELQLSAKLDAAFVQIWRGRIQSAFLPEYSDEDTKVVALQFLAKARELLTAQPGPVACEPLTGDELEAVIADWLSQPPDTCPRTELARMGAEAQFKKCKRKLQEAQPAPSVPAKTNTPALDERLGMVLNHVMDDYRCDLLRRAVASDTAGLRERLEFANEEIERTCGRLAEMGDELGKAEEALEAAKAERNSLAEQFRQACIDSDKWEDEAKKAAQT